MREAPSGPKAGQSPSQPGTRQGIRGILARLRREPLLHFIAAGALIFGLNAILAAPPSDVAGRSPVSLGAQDIERIAKSWQSRNGREPTAGELASAVDSAVDDELLFREAIALGLDRDDVIIRRRLVQKMAFLIEAAAARAEPDEAELQRWYGMRPERYAIPPKRDLELQSIGAAAAGLPAQFRGVSQRELARTFGSDFARAVFHFPAGDWHGPVESAYGRHRVRVSGHVPARVPELGEVRERVLADWYAERADTERERYLGELRGRYGVRVAEYLPPPAGARARDVAP